MGILDQELARFAQSDKFKKLTTDYLKKEVSNGSGRVTLALAQSAEYYRSRMEEILIDEMIWVGLGVYAGFNYEIVDTKKTLASHSDAPCVEINISFDEDVAFSPSLYPAKHTGVILPRLLNAGYSTEGNRRVFGPYYSKSNHSWVSNKQWSLPAREGLHFMEFAVERFNHEVGGLAEATYIKQSAKA